MVFPFRCCCADDEISLCDCFRPNADSDSSFGYHSGFRDCVLTSGGPHPGVVGPALATYMDEAVDTSDDEGSYYTEDVRHFMFGAGHYTCDMGCRPEGVYPTVNQNISVLQGWDEVASATLRLRARGWDKYGNGSVPNCNFKLLGKHRTAYDQIFLTGHDDNYDGETGTKTFSAVSGPECGANGWATYEFPLELSDEGDYPRHPVIWYGLTPGCKPGPPGGGFRMNIDTWVNEYDSFLPGVIDPVTEKPKIIGVEEAFLQISALEICLTGCLYDISGANPYGLPECACVARGDCKGPYPEYSG